MNEQQKPLMTEQIAGGRSSVEDDTPGTSRDQVETSERRTNDSAIEHPVSTTGESRSSMEAGYSESSMSDGAADRMGNAQSGSSSTRTGENRPALMPVEAAEGHREHWTDIQVRFVDDPKDAVQQADELVAEVMQTVASRFAEQRKTLESQWQGGGEASSEDLRQALLQYRSFFERLLAA